MKYHIIKIILEFLSSIAWPIITTIIFLIFRKPLKHLISNVRKIDFAGTAIETNFHVNQKTEGIASDFLSSEHDFNFFDKTLANFSNSTLEAVEKIVEKDTHITSLSDIEEKYNRLYKYSKLLVIINRAEKIYNLIYGSQIKLLQRLNSSIIESKDSLKFYYDTAAKYFPDTYKNYSYENYLEFLNFNELIKFSENDMIEITEIGRDF